MHVTSQGPAERDLLSQVHACNPTDPAEKELLCRKPALKVLCACSHEIPRCSHCRRVGGNRSRAQKWCWGDQNLEVKTESQSIE